MTQEQMLALGAPELPEGLFYRIRAGKRNWDAYDHYLEIRRYLPKKRFRKDNSECLSDCGINTTYSGAEDAEVAIAHAARRALKNMAAYRRKQEWEDTVKQHYGDHH